MRILVFRSIPWTCSSILKLITMTTGRSLNSVLLPTLAPTGNYLPALQVGNLLYLSGAICLVDGAMTHTGKIGETRDIAYGQQAARICALNLLAVAQAHIGDLDKIRHVVQLDGFVSGIRALPTARP